MALLPVGLLSDGKSVDVGPEQNGRRPPCTNLRHHAVTPRAGDPVSLGVDAPPGGVRDGQGGQTGLDY